MQKYLQKLKEVWKLMTLFILILLTFSYAMFQGGFVSWFLFYLRFMVLDYHFIRLLILAAKGNCSSMSLVLVKQLKPRYSL
jgi:hypothetical protein